VWEVKAAWRSLRRVSLNLLVTLTYVKKMEKGGELKGERIQSRGFHSGHQ